MIIVDEWILRPMINCDGLYLFLNIHSQSFFLYFKAQYEMGYKITFVLLAAVVLVPDTAGEKQLRLPGEELPLTPNPLPAAVPCTAVPSAPFSLNPLLIL